MPLWSAGGREPWKKKAKVAGYADKDSLGKIYRRLYEEERAAEIADGKAKERVSQTGRVLAGCAGCWRAGPWEVDVVEGVAELYSGAGLGEVCLLCTP
jgi:hypothetical protein